MSDQAIRHSHQAYGTATWLGSGEFFSGIRHGEAVKVLLHTQIYTTGETVKAHTSVSVQSLSDPGAWLSVNRASDVGNLEIGKAV